MNTDDLLNRLDRTFPVLMSKISHRTRAPGMGPAAMVVLRKLRHSGECTVSELAEWLDVTSATVTGITNKLAAQGFISRSRENRDRRVVKVGITEAGLTALSEVEKIRRARVAEVLSTLSSEDLQKLAEIADKLLLAMETE